MHSSTVFALLATVAVSFALPGNYIPDGPPSPTYPTPAGSPSSPDPATNTPPAGPPNPAPAPAPAPGSPTPAPAPAPGSTTTNNCSIQQASACCVGDATPQNGGLLSILGAVAPCGLTLLSQVCSANVYCCDYHNEGQSSLVNLQTCGPLVAL